MLGARKGVIGLLICVLGSPMARAGAKMLCKGETADVKNVKEGSPQLRRRVG